MADRMYSPKQVAEYLDIGYIKALDLIRDGTLKATKVGNRYRIPEYELDRLFQRELQPGDWANLDPRKLYRVRGDRLLNLQRRISHLETQLARAQR